MAVTPALTTVFVPPTSCFQPTFTIAPVGNASFNVLNDADQWIEITPGVATQFYPAEYWLASPSVTGLASFYSPGLCPSGWIGVATSIVDSSTGVECCSSDAASIVADSTPVCYNSITSAIVVDGGSTTSTSGSSWFFVYS